MEVICNVCFSHFWLDLDSYTVTCQEQKHESILDNHLCKLVYIDDFSHNLKYISYTDDTQRTDRNLLYVAEKQGIVVFSAQNNGGWCLNLLARQARWWIEHNWETLSQKHKLDHFRKIIPEVDF